MQAAWRAGVPCATEAPWATELSAAQRRTVSQTMKREPKPTAFSEKIGFTLTAILVPVAFLSVPRYPLLQAFTLW